MDNYSALYLWNVAYHQKEKESEMLSIFYLIALKLWRMHVYKYLEVGMWHNYSM